MEQHQETKALYNRIFIGEKKIEKNDRKRIFKKQWPNTFLKSIGHRSQHSSTRKCRGLQSNLTQKGVHQDV